VASNPPETRLPGCGRTRRILRVTVGDVAGWCRSPGWVVAHSTEVQQHARIWADPCARASMVTCADRRLWTPCLRFASKGSGVRAPLAPPQLKDLIRTLEPGGSEACTATKYSGWALAKRRSGPRIKLVTGTRTPGRLSSTAAPQAVGTPADLPERVFIQLWRRHVSAITDSSPRPQICLFRR